MAPILKFHRSKELIDSEFAAVYLLTYLSVRYPKLWLGSRNKEKVSTQRICLPWKNYLLNLEPNIVRRLEEFETIGDIFENFALKSTPQTVNRSMLMWDQGSYPLELMFRIPLPREVLEQQRKGKRCVSIILDKEKTCSYILGQRDPLSFTMHDLIHADHFYHNNDSYLGQLGFYGLLDYCLRQEHFESLYQNKNFMEEFEYLISDMNAYFGHLLKCLKAAMTHFHPQKETFFADWILKVSSNPEEQDALSRLNTPAYNAYEDDAVLARWMNNWVEPTLRR